MINYKLPRIIFALSLVIIPISCIHKLPKNQKKYVDVENNYSESISLLRTMTCELMKLPTTPPGISVAIGVDYKIIYSEGFGFADKLIGKKITPKTQFRAGSLSRLFTTTALLKLTDKKLINLNYNVHDFITAYPKKKYPISLKQLALGISGLPRYHEKDKLENKNYLSVEESLGVFSDIPSYEKPGNRYRFSAYGYTLLSRIMEKATKKNFIQILNDEVLNPLQMSSTTAESLLKSKSDLTKYYKFTEESIYEVITNPKNYSYSWAGSGLITTPSDLVLLSHSLTNQFLSDEIIQTTFEKQLLNSGDTLRENIGWDMNWDMADRKVYEQDGAGEGTRNIISLFPDYKLSISIMTNAMRLTAIEETAHTLAIPFLSKANPTPQPKGKIELKVFEDYKGKWVEKTGTLILSDSENKLIINPGQKNKESYKLIYLNRKNMYALIHTDGILYTEINQQNNKITGKVMFYRGPNILKTSSEKPYLKFNS